jgi:hypothetical protein
MGRSSLKSLRRKLWTLVITKSLRPSLRLVRLSSARMNGSPGCHITVARRTTTRRRVSERTWHSSKACHLLPLQPALDTTFLPIVFALALHCLSDSVGTEFPKPKSGLLGFDDFDEPRQTGTSRLVFRFLGGQRMFKRFPSKPFHLLFPFLSFYAQHAWASEIVRCFGGNYLGI